MSAPAFTPATAQQCAALIKSGEVSALEFIDAALARIGAGDSGINSYTAITAERARSEARAVDRARARGDILPPLAGVPYAVKNLFNIKRLVTLAGAKIRVRDTPASADAALVRRLSAASAVLTGALNMDAYAYGFTTENTHFGATRNPRDVSRVAGGSSGGSAAAVAAGFATFTLAVALGASKMVGLQESDRARAAAFVITAAEAGALYLDELRARMDDFEPLSRDRLIAGALLPAARYLKAQRFRRWYQQEARKLFERFDLLIAPATPCTATSLGAERMLLNGVELPVRANLGLLTQPISFIGLPVAVAPLWCAERLPIGVQLIAPPWREDICLRAAWALEQSGIACSPVSPACAAIHSDA